MSEAHTTYRHRHETHAGRLGSNLLLAAASRCCKNPENEHKPKANDGSSHHNSSEGRPCKRIHFFHEQKQDGSVSQPRPGLFAAALTGAGDLALPGDLARVGDFGALKQFHGRRIIQNSR